MTQPYQLILLREAARGFYTDPGATGAESYADWRTYLDSLASDGALTELQVAHSPVYTERMKVLNLPTDFIGEIDNLLRLMGFVVTYSDPSPYERGRMTVSRISPAINVRSTAFWDLAGHNGFEGRIKQIVRMPELFTIAELEDLAALIAASRIEEELKHADQC